MTTHGMSKSPEFGIWQSMKSRCYNPKTRLYHRYGGRGIKVCDRWLTSFKNFYEDMGPRPSSKHTLERRENDGNYEPDNCKWATPLEQSYNRHNTVIIETANDGKLTTLQIRKLTGIKERTLRTRLARGSAIDKPVRVYNAALIDFRGEELSLAEIARRTDCNYHVLRRYFHQGHHPQDAVEIILSEKSQKK